MDRQIRLVVAAAAVVLSSGCNGWPDAPPYDQAVNRPEKYETYAASAAEAVPMFTAEHHRYMLMPTRADVRTARTRAVGTAAGSSVFALEGDDAPYGNLFAQDASGNWRPAAVID